MRSSSIRASRGRLQNEFALWSLQAWHFGKTDIGKLDIFRPLLIGAPLIYSFMAAIRALMLHVCGQFKLDVIDELQEPHTASISELHQSTQVSQGSPTRSLIAQSIRASRETLSHTLRTGQGASRMIAVTFV